MDKGRFDDVLEDYEHVEVFRRELRLVRYQRVDIGERQPLFIEYERGIIVD